MTISRRKFVGMTGLAAATTLSGEASRTGRGAVKTYRAAVIGRTGRGNYGHGIEPPAGGRNQPLFGRAIAGQNATV